MCTLTNSEDHYEMPHNASVHKGLHCLLRHKQSLEKEMLFYLEIITSDPLTPRIIPWTMLILFYPTRWKYPLDFALRVKKSVKLSKAIDPRYVSSLLQNYYHKL